MRNVPPCPAEWPSVSILAPVLGGDIVSPNLARTLRGAGHDGKYCPKLKALSKSCKMLSFFTLVMNSIVKNLSRQHGNVAWRMSRIGARIVLRSERGALSARDKRVAAEIISSGMVSARLINRAREAFESRRHEAVAP